MLRHLETLLETARRPSHGIRLRRVHPFAMAPDGDLHLPTEHVAAARSRAPADGADAIAPNRSASPRSAVADAVDTQRAPGQPSPAPVPVTGDPVDPPVAERPTIAPRPSPAEEPSMAQQPMPAAPAEAERPAVESPATQAPAPVAERSPGRSRSRQRSAELDRGDAEALPHHSSVPTKPAQAATPASPATSPAAVRVDAVLASPPPASVRIGVADRDDDDHNELRSPARRSAATTSGPAFELRRQIDDHREQPAGRIVDVHIGRIDVRATPAPTKPRRERSAPLGLADYLQQQRGRQ